MKYRVVPLFLLISLALLSSCGSKPTDNQTTEGEGKAEVQKPAIAKYPPHIGDIAFDPQQDTSDFKPCNSLRIPQYYALGADFRVPNEVLMGHFGTASLPANDQTGYYTIRFIVNCTGKTGRYREQSMSVDYQNMKFDSAFTEVIKSRLVSFDQWPQGRDFYQYLTFKIEQGKITEVLP